MSSCRVAQQRYLFSRPADTVKISPTSLFLVFFQRYICIWGFIFYQPSYLVKKRGFLGWFLHTTQWSWRMHFILSEKCKQECWGYLGLKMQDLCMYSLWNVYMCFPHIKALFRGVTNGSSMKVVSCVPFLPFLGGMPVWVGSVGSVFWDCSWGYQGVKREEKRDQNKREKE